MTFRRTLELLETAFALSPEYVVWTDPTRASRSARPAHQALEFAAADLAPQTATQLLAATRRRWPHGHLHGVPVPDRVTGQHTVVRSTLLVTTREGVVDIDVIWRVCPRWADGKPVHLWDNGRLNLEVPRLVDRLVGSGGHNALSLVREVCDSTLDDRLAAALSAVS